MAWENGEKASAAAWEAAAVTGEGAGVKIAVAMFMAWWDSVKNLTIAGLVLKGKGRASSDTEQIS